MTINWSNGNGTNRMVVAKAGSAIAGTPGNGATYLANSSFGSGSVLNAGEFVVYNGTGSSVTVTNLALSTTYFFRVYDYNCSPTQYLTSTTTGNPSSQATTASCSAPTAQASAITFSGVSTNQMTVNWSNGNGTNRIVVAKAGSAIAGTPGNGATYSANSSFGSGSVLNAGEFVVYNGTGTSVTVTNLAVSTTYFFRVFEYSCSPTQYLNSTTTGNPSSQATTASCSSPTAQANSISFTGVSTNQMTVNWTSGNGTNRTVPIPTC